MRDMNESASVIAGARQAGRTALDELAGKALLAAAGIAVPLSVMVRPGDDLEQALRVLRYPVALKVMSPDLLHKSDAGGVTLHLSSVAEVRDAIAAMATLPAIAAAKPDGYLVEEMAAPGQEVVIGAVNDVQFGPMIMVGLGGIFVEILADVAFRICPITRLDAEEMLAELKGVALLDGARGRKPASRAAIVDALMKLGGANGLLMQLAQDFAEVDINPLIVSGTAAVAVDARFILSTVAAPAQPADEAANPPAATSAEQSASILEQFAPLYEARTVAVVGASSKGEAGPNIFMRRMKAYGFDGDVYPIHPTASEIDGLPAYPSLAATPDKIDYAYIAVPAAQVPAVLASAAGRVRFAQVISSGFGELDEGRQLQAQLVAAARAGGMRLIGPNCLGLYTPRGKITFSEIAPRELGTVGIISQSGGLATDIIRRGMGYGLRFSGLVTVGNCADVQPSELLQYHLADVQTRVIGIYIETAADARRLFELLRGAGAAKPVVILKGGRTAQGLAAAASHTGALAGDARAWTALSRQTGCVLVDTLNEFLEALLIFQTLTPNGARPTERVALFGNGGGTSVLATDYFARLGLNVSPFAPEVVRTLEALKLPPGTSVTNPVDTPVTTLQQEEGRAAEKILDLILGQAKPDALVMHLNMSVFAGRVKPEVLDNLVQAALRAKERHPGHHLVLVLRSDGEPGVEVRKREFRAYAVQLGIPVFDEMSNAGHALAALATHERFLHRGSSQEQGQGRAGGEHA
jgi:acyl-CoA synthetase (NDP forming)